ncbi:major facilitator superfamily domain-containing protein, partial [Clohesyomyces aquaticus]
PFCAQLSDLFGRKYPLLISLAIFFVGGAVAAAARSSGALIAGRTVQGLGSGGILLLMEVVVCDIVPLRERGKYLGIVLSTAAIGAIAGPPIGGAIANQNWRWIFWVNLPVSGAVFIVLALFMKSWNIVVPLALGTLGWLAFHLYESILCSKPTVPRHLFANRTSSAGFGICFLHSLLTTWVAFQWPTYFQAVLHTTPLEAGIKYLAFEAFLIPSAGICGFLVSKTGVFRPYKFIGFNLLALGGGLNILLGPKTRTVTWVVLIAINAVGLGSLQATMLPAILASLEEKDVALATGMYSFLRSFGFIWGVTIPAIIFNASFDLHSWQISDPALRDMLSRGRAFEYVSGELVKDLPSPVREELAGVYAQSLQVGWKVATGFAAVGILLVLIEKHVPLRTTLDTEYGLQERPQGDDKTKFLA